MYWILSYSNKPDFAAMMCGFGMTGQFSSTKGKHPAFVYEFTDGTSVYFNDPRHFGNIKFTNNFQILETKLNSLGWEPMQDQLDDWLPFLIEKINCKKTLSELLLDQSIFNGTGNYLLAESLYEAKLSPWRLGNSISKAELVLLCNAITNACKISYSHQGASFSTFKDPYGNEGKYSSLFKIYQQKKDPFGNAIIKEATPNGRTTHWCPSIQK
jgi:formamidopyrimidine-DNA glycosylase